MTDTELLNWLGEQIGGGIISDFTGRWAFSFDGEWSFDVESENWQPSIRQAINYAIKIMKEQENNG